MTARFSSADDRTSVSFAEAVNLLPPPEGERSAAVFEHGSLQVKLYAPRGEDSQTPHARDEAYVVVQGSGEYVNGGSRQPFRVGDFLFAAAGVEHRFEDFTDDLYVWVIFYGPEGGELADRNLKGGSL